MYSVAVITTQPPTVQDTTKPPTVRDTTQHPSVFPTEAKDLLSELPADISGSGSKVQSDGIDGDRTGTNDLDSLSKANSDPDGGRNDPGLLDENVPDFFEPLLS